MNYHGSGERYDLSRMLMTVGRELIEIIYIHFVSKKWVHFFIS